MRRFAGLLVSIVVVMAACSGSDGSPASITGASSTIATTTAATTSTSTTTTAAAVDVATASDAFELVMSWLEDGPPAEVVYERVFSDAFLSQVTYDRFVGILEQLGALGPWTIGQDQVLTTGERATVIDPAAARAEPLVVQLAVADGVITGLFFSPVTAEFEEPLSIEAAIDRLGQMGRVRLLVADRDGGTCEPIVDMDAGEVMPIASTFKLYVLEALNVAVVAGDLAWLDPVTIRDELDSLPTGTTQDLEPGSERTVRELAELMISISDNTATDHLIDLVGRSAVEAAVASSGHAEPTATVPFLTTKEMFLLKLAASDAGRAAYVDADVDARRAFLDTELPLLDLPTVDELEWTEPVEIETIEWFASPHDLCRLVGGLVGIEESREIMSLNPGLPDEAGRWSYIGFKGGSEPGVLTVAWYVESAEGEAYVVAGGVANPDESFDQEEAVRLLGWIRDSIGEPVGG